MLALRPDEVPDLFGPEALHRLSAATLVDPDTPVAGRPDQLAPRTARALAEADILLTSWGSPRIDLGFLDAAPKLRLLVHAAGTIKPLVVPEIFERGVRVCSAAEANAVPVAEYTLAAVILGAKRAFPAAARYRSGVRAADGTHRDLDGLGWIGTWPLTVGVIGASRIGRKVVRLLRQVLDADVLVYDPYGLGGLDDDPRVRAADLDGLLAACDVVTVHAPLTPESRGMIDARRLALLRDGTVLVNTARGPIVDGPALARELASGRIDAVLDVTDPEPLPPESELFDLPNVFVTPHIAGSLGREVRRLGLLAVGEVERFASGLPLRYEVFPDQLDRLA
ncbi:hydroxyacid dehydrogenase [Catenulispora subtropica]|uniref:Hydroxyacid dehydrogenase n=1 Tax=Catenulispora subtropica TaxID=450798 RepID=A0ABN2STI0_9ACTN